MKSIFRILSFILAVFCITQSELLAQLTTEDIWLNRAYRTEGVWGLRSMADGLHYTAIERTKKGKALMKFSYENGEAIKTIVINSDIKDAEGESIELQNYTFSADESKLLIGTDTEYIYRYSTRETNYVYDVDSGSYDLLDESGKQAHATFSPGANKVAFVRENNLFIKNLETSEFHQVTADGEVNKIIYGAADWVYEEEFGFDKAFFWAPDGKKIAFYRFDESGVKEFNMPGYGGLYPQDYRFKYPKAGEDNALVSIHIYDVQSGETIEAALGQYEYIPRIKWSATSEYLSVTTLNRHQNHLKLLKVNSETGEASTFIEEKSETYIDIDDHLTFIGENEGFIWSSEKSGFLHLYLYDFDGNKETQLTKGNWEISKFYGYDSNSGVLFFQAAKRDALNREVYSFDIANFELKCLTPEPGWHSAKFSEGFKFFLHTHSTINSPSKVSLKESDGEHIRVLKDNAALKENMSEQKLPKMAFDQLLTERGDTLNYWMLKPAGFEADKKYPLVMMVYGGPGSQTVENSWPGTNYFGSQLLAQNGYIVVSVDNRGTGGRGRDFKHCTYLQLGKLETEDQISAAKYLGGLSFIDAERIGIWGWSYGGFMSSLCLFKGADVFKTAIAVAPVTNWKYYDTVYTERYMRTPEENEGYESNSPITYTDGLEGNYLLIHGTGDDNVHFQNTVEICSALQKSGKQFDLMIYPDKNHGIYGGNTRWHLNEMMLEYWLENL